MKKLITLVALALSFNASAGTLGVGTTNDYKEVFTRYTETVEIVLTNQPCLKWEAPAGMQLNFAYALDTVTKERVTGCFTHDDHHIIIQLSDEATKQHFEFKINPDAFQPRANI